ncbi:MAG: phosphotransferase [Anaerolineales bacterium]
MPSTPWEEPGWFESASAWIQEQLKNHCLSMTGEITQPHIRPWSTVLNVPTDAGILYFKASAPSLAYEPRLTEALVRWRPDLMPELLGSDLERGWLLMRDSGEPIRESIRTTGDLSHWEVVLPAYAELQIELSDRAEELLSLGLLDRRLEGLPAQFERLLEDTESMGLGQPEGLTQTKYEKLQELQPKFAHMCARLAKYGIPESLHHDDFHDANVFLRDSRYILTDWGETCVSHPFFSILVCIRSTAYSMKWDFNDPRLISLRDTYLKAWERFASPADLLAAFRLAMPVAMVNRALTWHHVVSQLEGESHAEYAEAVPGWLMEFLEAETEAPISL